jgi:predicted aspartyl protease
LVFSAMLAVSVAIAAPPAAEPAPKPVVLPLSVSLGHPSIEVRIDGKGPYRLLFDTGSGADLIIDQELAAEVGLATTGTRRLGDPNSPEAIEAQVVKIGRVELGGLTLRDVEAISWKRDVLDMVDSPRGVVGLGLFGSRLVTLDSGQGQLIVEPGELAEPDGRTILKASFEDGIPSVGIDVAGVKFRAHLDSGSTAFLGLPAGAVDTLPLAAAPVKVGRARTASGDYSVTEASLKGAARIGDIVIDKPKVRFVNLPQANIGFDLLRSLVVTVDRKNERVRLVASGRPIEPSERPRLGILLPGPKDGRLPISQVAAGSPAEAAGLRAGDEIVRLNGRTAVDLTPFELSQVLQSRPLAITLLRGGASVDVTVGAKMATP